MFIPIKSTDGAMTPFEYIEAAAGTYQVGQLLNVTDGKLAAIAADQATTPPYVCMQSGTVAAGELLAVTRVQDKYTFETELAAAAAAVKVGTKINIKLLFRMWTAFHINALFVSYPLNCN